MAPVVGSENKESLAGKAWPPFAENCRLVGWFLTAKEKQTVQPRPPAFGIQLSHQQHTFRHYLLSQLAIMPQSPRAFPTSFGNFQPFLALPNRRRRASVAERRWRICGMSAITLKTLSCDPTPATA
jgi:hypothetical protein